MHFVYQRHDHIVLKAPFFDLIRVNIVGGVREGLLEAPARNLRRLLGDCPGAVTQQDAKRED